jgi:hypothetical protein
MVNDFVSKKFNFFSCRNGQFNPSWLSRHNDVLSLTLRIYIFAFEKPLTNSL